jgi:putative intracellular protease/amidase
MKTKFIILATMLVTALAFQAKAQAVKSKKVLIVVTSHDKMGNINRSTGLWLGEFAAPFYTLTDAGVEVTIASPKGGLAPIDTFSLNKSFATEATRRYQSDPAAQVRLSKTVKLSSVSAKDYDAVFYPGGHGPMWDLAEDKTSEKLIENFYNNGKTIAFVCHGPVALKHAVDKNGVAIVKGKIVSGFTNGEEAAVGLTNVVPFLTEDLLKQLGGKYQKGADWSPFAVQDGLLISGQNPQSAQLVGEKLLQALTQNSAAN